MIFQACKMACNSSFPTSLFYHIIWTSDAALGRYNRFFSTQEISEIESILQEKNKPYQRMAGTCVVEDFLCGIMDCIAYVGA